MYYDAMGNGLIIVGIMVILLVVVGVVFIASAVMLGILLHKKRKENGKAGEGASANAPKEE